MEKSGTLLVFLGLLVTVLASDPDLTTDFNVSSPNAEDFTFIGFRNPQPLGQGMAAPTPANNTGLNGLGLAIVLFEFGPVSQIDPHTHPRATEVFYLLSGVVDVGFVDTSNTLFMTTLQAGDLFVFPKGLMHFQRNNYNNPALGYSALSSENPGTLMIAKALFTSTDSGTSSNTGLPDNVLATAFHTDVKTVDYIKKILDQPPPSPSY